MIGPVLVVGGGRCGLQLARSLAAAGVDVTVTSHGVLSMRRARSFGLPIRAQEMAVAAARTILLAVPDDVLHHGDTLRLGTATPPAVVLHTSGLHPGRVLEGIAPPGCPLGSFHPLVSFPSPAGTLVSLKGRWAALEGDPQAVRRARRLARTLGMASSEVPTEMKSRYHAAAAVAANLTHTLTVVARSQLEQAGLSRKQAGQVLAPLVAEATSAALQASGWEALTGPLARGDEGTLTAHRRALPPEIWPAYAAVAHLAVAGLQHQGLLDAATAENLMRALTARD